MTLNARHEMLAALCMIGDGEKGRSLFAFLPPSEQEPLERLGLQLRRDEGGTNTREILRRIRKLAQIQRWSGLEEIHPGWILEALIDESPRVLGLICRFLSGEKVHYILNHLPPQERIAFPKLTQSYAVSPDIVEIVRTLVEKKLELALPPRTGTFSFNHLALIQGEDLRIVFRELGLDELRRAFSTADPQLFKAFLSRFSPVQAREMRERVERSVAVSPEEKQKAQLHLLSLSLGSLPSEELFREIGFSLFAKGVTPEEGVLVRQLGHRLPPEEGYRLWRLVKEAKSDTAERRVLRERVLSLIFSLGARKKIGKYWKEERDLEPTGSEVAA